MVIPIMQTTNAVSKSEARSIDRHVGTCMRRRRTIFGLTQLSVARGIGVSFQQIQKYESGANRIAASTLYRLSKCLGMKPHEFFEGLNPQTADGPSEERLKGALPPIHVQASDPINRRETLELVRAVEAITDQQQRDAFVSLIYAFGAENVT